MAVRSHSSGSGDSANGDGQFTGFQFSCVVLLLIIIIIIIIIITIVNIIIILLPILHYTTLH